MRASKQPSGPSPNEIRMRGELDILRREVVKLRRKLAEVSAAGAPLASDAATAILPLIETASADPLPVTAAAEPAPVAIPGSTPGAPAAADAGAVAPASDL